MIAKMCTAVALVLVGGFGSICIGSPQVQLDGEALPSIVKPLVGGGGGLPDCIQTCVYDAYIYKEEVHYDSGCAPLPWQVPHRTGHYYCYRYSCQNGVYYQAGTVGAGDCTDEGLAPVACPSGTCSP